MARAGRSARPGNETALAVSLRAPAPTPRDHGAAVAPTAAPRAPRRRRSRHGSGAGCAVAAAAMAAAALAVGAWWQPGPPPETPVLPCSRRPRSRRLSAAHRGGLVRGAGLARRHGGAPRLRAPRHPARRATGAHPAARRAARPAAHASARLSRGPVRRRRRASPSNRCGARAGIGLDRRQPASSPSRLCGRAPARRRPRHRQAGVGGPPHALGGHRRGRRPAGPRCAGRVDGSTRSWSHPRHPYRAATLLALDLLGGDSRRARRAAAS